MLTNWADITGWESSILQMNIEKALRNNIKKYNGGKRNEKTMQKNAEKIESALLNFKMDIAMGDGTDDVSLGMDMNMETTTEPEASHGKGTVSISMSGMDFSVETEMYSVQEDGEYVTYTLISV